MALGARIERLYGADAGSGRTVLDVRYLNGRFGLAVHRAALFSVLYEAVIEEGIGIETAAEVEAVEPGDTGVRLVGGKGRALGSFDLVVDASGARSKLRRQARAPTEPRPLAYGAFWASLGWRADGFDAHALLQRYDKASVMIGVLPIGRAARGGEPMAAFFWSLKPTEADAVRAAGIDAWKDRVLRLWPQCGAFTSQIGSFDQLSLARYGHHTLLPPVGRRLAVIGDSAHSTSPQLGQGANMALLDARALAQALEHAPDLDTALAIYAASRRWHVWVFQALSWMFTPFYQSDSVVLPFMRDRLVATLARIPPVPRFLASMVAGTLVDPFARIGLREADWEIAGRHGTVTETSNRVKSVN